jgi:hypothetical protein
MNRKPRKLPSKPKHDLLSVKVSCSLYADNEFFSYFKDVWRNDEQRREELKAMFNTETVGERDFLLRLLLDESDEDSATEENITEEDLQCMLKIHRKRRKLQKRYHADALNSQASIPFSLK